MWRSCYQLSTGEVISVYTGGSATNTARKKHYQRVNEVYSKQGEGIKINLKITGTKPNTFSRLQKVHFNFYLGIWRPDCFNGFNVGDASLEDRPPVSVVIFQKNIPEMSGRAFTEQPSFPLVR